MWNFFFSELSESKKIYQFFNNTKKQIFVDQQLQAGRGGWGVLTVAGISPCAGATEKNVIDTPEISSAS